MPLGWCRTSRETVPLKFVYSYFVITTWRVYYIALATRTKDVLKQQKILRTLHEFRLRDKNLNFICRSFSCQRINCHCLRGRWLFKALVNYAPVLTIKGQPILWRHFRRPWKRSACLVNPTMDSNKSLFTIHDSTVANCFMLRYLSLYRWPISS